MFNEFTIVCITKLIFRYSNEFFLKSSQFDFYLKNRYNFEYFLPYFLLIRPSDNTLNAKRFERMFTCEIVQEIEEIVKIDWFEFLSKNYSNVHFPPVSKFTFYG